MSEFVVRIDDRLASYLSRIAMERYDGDQNAAISEALLLFFLQPIQKNRRRIAQLIFELREQSRSAGGVTDDEIKQLIHEYRQRKKEYL